ncbi:AT-rich interactive domain-containing protein 4B isoform X1 [Carassius gibelio]|uniref:AT-rich interactive domain-containing protein 4B isoform X1 n=1 Tax=Carassius gibelio TaxID=101364 RepID=UPI002279864C|nr:AT-rich interactive domain-containing protein 4B isoform X1 [Carassius gibelio]
MKTLEEPPYLTVGTDVSAKYRGAFCEAKIKTAKRLVKAKVTFKPSSSTAEVHDEHIRGLLKVGAVVEARNPDGVYQEATINKLTDASLYTVVFNDGDEKTLRRSSLCLKGARHFAESETLDRLPLTNPEHFGSPVIGKKGNRGGRRSNPIQEEESSSSSSEEEEGDQQQNEELYGKVVCVDGVVTIDKKKSTWYPALVISPDCHEDVSLKKDNVFVRSFKDGKFYTVLRKDVRALDEEKAPKADAGLKPALDAARAFQRNGTVPSTWRTEVKDESSSSEEEDEEEEEEQEEEASSEEEEEEVEPFPEEKDNFLQQLYKFMEDRGTPINKRPVLGYRNLNLFKLYRLVQKLGGFDNIESGSVWKQVYQDLGIPVLNSAAGYNVKCAYRKYLYGFEDFCASTGITFRMDLPYKTAEKTSSKSEVNAEETAISGNAVSLSTSSAEEEEKALKEAETSSVQHVSKEEDAESIAPCEDKEDISSLHEEEEEEDNHADEEENDSKEEAEEFIPTAQSPVTESVKEEPCEEHHSKDLSGDVSSQEWEEGEEFECYPPGMKVQVRYGRGRNQKTYEATVKESDLEGGEVLYLVHYCGWNVRYDEWIKADKIVRPANKNVPKIKHRKKIKNKAERERDRIERLTDTVDLPSPKNRFNRLSKPNSGSDAFSTKEEYGDEGSQQMPVKSIEITSILNGLPGSESSTDDSEREDDGDADLDEEDHPGARASLRKAVLPERPLTPQHWESGSPSEAFKAPADEEPSVQNSPETSKRKVELEGSGGRRKKAGGQGESPLKSPGKGRTRSCRGGDWLPSSSPKKLEERGPVEDRGAQSCSSSEDEADPPTEPQTKEEPRGNPKTKGSPSKKYNGVKDKNKSGRSVFWDIPEKRAKISTGIEERSPGCRTKGQKDVWSSIQVQWPKKTLKELFSDSDTEAANSPPPAVTAPDEPCVEPSRDEEIAEDKLQEHPSSGTNSVLNTPPTTPESPAVGEGPAEVRAPSPPTSPPAVSSPTGALLEEQAGGRSESDSSTVEVESMGGEIQEIPQEDGAGSPSKAFDGNLSCNSNSNCSLTMSNCSQLESEQKNKAASSQKRHKESQGGGASKKHKRSHKGLSLHPKKNRKPAHSSDSEDQCMSESTAKSPTSKSSSEMKRTPPSGHKYHKHGDPDHSHGRGRWSFQMSDLEKMSSLERIAFLQEKLQDIRNHYLLLKSEVASIDRRRKRMKKKERETGAAASSSSSSPSSSSLTAAVMLTLAEPTVSSAPQTSGLSVECR